MMIGKVVGKVVSTVKYPSLVGTKLFLVQIPWDSPGSRVELAVDSVRAASEGDMVYLIDSSEAAASMRKGLVPTDLAIVGLVEHCYREGR
ncbi:MAG: EutN/CcmL family microcompartment protein [Lachnospiraceae bacterium]|nr:EutN/CcmL family microcompartment protein [Lachnospiraceae bacterium]